MVNTRYCPQCHTAVLRVLDLPRRIVKGSDMSGRKAGDWVCVDCPSNGRGLLPVSYWHDDEVLPLQERKA